MYLVVDNLNMNVHLVRSSEYNAEEFWKVLELLRQYPGPLKFITTEQELKFEDSSISEITLDKEEFFRKEMVANDQACYSSSFPKTRPSIKWPEIFSRIRGFRTEKDIGEKEFVGLLTSMHNEFNWFSAPSLDGKYDFFIDTGCWEDFVDCDARYPIAYTVASNVLRLLMLPEIKDPEKYFHMKPRGCMNDFNKDKTEVTLKLRTSDICPECMHLIRRMEIDNKIVSQVLQIFEGIRTHILFKERFAQSVQPSRLKVTNEGRMLLEDLSSYEVRLTPIERTIYLFFLESDQGYNLTDLNDHKDQLYNLYIRFSSFSNLAAIRNSIDDLVDITSNSLSEKISSIKRKFIHAVGEELAEYYYIKGPRGERKSIAIDRRFVSWEMDR